jgi:hypothetical protein
MSIQSLSLDSERVAARSRLWCRNLQVIHGLVRVLWCKLHEMRKLALVLRIVLCASLVLNGLSAAAATVRMQGMAHVPNLTHRVSVDTGSSTSEPPCHGGHGSGMAPAVHASQHIPAAAAQKLKQEGPPPDCCKSGHCQCASLPCLPYTASAVRWHGATWRLLAARSLTTTHASPSLTKLTRPPIA